MDKYRKLSPQYSKKTSKRHLDKDAENQYPAEYACQSAIFPGVCKVYKQLQDPRPEK